MAGTPGSSTGGDGQLLTTVCPVALFDAFIAAGTLRGIQDAFARMCTALTVDTMLPPQQFYAR